MNKKEIVNSISESTGVSKTQTREIVQKTFDAITHALVTERRIELRNFGVFEVKKRAARNTRNPKTGELMSIPERYFVNFKPGKEMEERVRRLMVKSVSEAIEEAQTHEPNEGREGTDPDSAH